jgi:hypothetical protein
MAALAEEMAVPEGKSARPTGGGPFCVIFRHRNIFGALAGRAFDLASSLSRMR